MRTFRFTVERTGLRSMPGARGRRGAAWTRSTRGASKGSRWTTMDSEASEASAPRRPPTPEQVKYAPLPTTGSPRDPPCPTSSRHSTTPGSAPTRCCASASIRAQQVSGALAGRPTRSSTSAARSSTRLRRYASSFKPQIAYFAAHRAEDQLEQLIAHIPRASSGLAGHSRREARRHRQHRGAVCA